MIDFEDITKKIIAFLREEIDTGAEGIKTRLNAEILLKNAEKGDTMLEEVEDKESNYVLSQMIRETATLKNFIDITIAEAVKLDSNFDTAAKEYAIQLSSLKKDDLKSNMYYRSVRMAEVLKNIMVAFYKCNKELGFTYGETTALSMPERVKTEGGKTIKSGVTYLITIL